jgi:hypothetical protein
MYGGFWKRNSAIDLIQNGSISFQEVEISPSVTLPSLKPICLPDEFSRALRVQDETSFEMELSRLSEGDKLHSSTMAYCLSDVTFYKNEIVRIGRTFSGRRKNRIPALVGRAAEFDEGALCSNGVTERYFGHWMHDGLVMELLAEEMGLLSIVNQVNPWSHAEGYRELLALRPQPVLHGRFKRLWTFDDRGLNQSRNKRLQALRGRLKASNLSPSHSPESVFIRRGASGTGRSLTNEDDISSLLSKRGFQIVTPEQIDARSLNSALRNASLCIAVEGSAQSHYLVNGPGSGALLSIQPPERFNSFFKPFCDSIGWRWGYVVADKVSADSFYLCPDRLLKTIDLYQI